MTVYVDASAHPFRGMLMCHMLADSLFELHAMADRIGMQRRWFQPRSFPHYDLNEQRRALAVAAGAVEVDRRGIANVMRRLRADPGFMAAARAEAERHQREFGR